MFGFHSRKKRRIEVSIAGQTLRLFKADRLEREWSVSTATNGAGERSGSECTPRGAHIVRAKIGQGLPVNAVLMGRRPTGEVYSGQLAERYPDRDWVLTRILWLSGCEPGRNRLGDVDSMRRYIYIHGTPDSEPMGEPRSHGCVRMRNEDLLQLFERVDVGCEVLIRED